MDLSQGQDKQSPGTDLAQMLLLHSCGADGRQGTAVKLHCISQGKRGACSCFYLSSTEFLTVKKLILVSSQTFLTDPAKLEGECAYIVLGHSARFSRLKCADVLTMVRQSSVPHGEETALWRQSGKGSEYFLHCTFKAVSITIIWELKH